MLILLLLCKYNVSWLYKIKVSLNFSPINFVREILKWGRFDAVLIRNNRWYYSVYKANAVILEIIIKKSLIFFAGLKKRATFAPVKRNTQRFSCEMQAEFSCQRMGKFTFTQWAQPKKPNLRSKCGNSSVGRAQPCPKEIRFPTLARWAKTKGLRKQNAEIAQLVEHNLAKVGVASSSLVFRSLWNFDFS